MKLSTLLSVVVVGLSSPSEGFGIESRKYMQTIIGNNSEARTETNIEENMMVGIVKGSILGLTLAVSGVAPALAVSGGGLDFAGLDISGQDFSNNGKTYKGKDFTQVLAKATNFANSNLQGCRFYKAYLVNTDFSNADIRGVSYFLFNTIENNIYYVLLLITVIICINLFALNL